MRNGPACHPAVLNPSQQKQYEYDEEHDTD